MEEKCNVAIVGCGIISQTHLQALKKVNAAKVVAVCDTDEEKAIAASKKWNVHHYYSDFSKMLSNEEICILSILTPPSSHAFLAIEAIKRGINVVIEKPLTMTTKEADSIIQVLARSKAKMTVVYHWLFGKAMLKTLSLISSQEIGDILHVDLKMVQPGKDDPMASDPNHWCHKTFGGRFGEMLPHPIYVLQSILGNNLQVMETMASKRGDIPWLTKDELRVIFQGEKGSGHLYVSLNAPRPLVNVDVYGTKQILKIDLTRQMVLKLGHATSGKLSQGKESIAEGLRLFVLTAKNSLEYSFRKVGEQGISRFYTMFIDSIKKGTSPPVTPEMAYNTVRIVEEICTDIASNRKMN